MKKCAIGCQPNDQGKKEQPTIEYFVSDTLKLNAGVGFKECSYNKLPMCS